MSKGKFIAMAAALGLALLAGPAVGQNADAIKLRVPVQLKSMLAATVSVTCRIFRGTDELGAQWGGAHKIVNGEFNEVVEVEVKALGGQSFLGADGYRCDLKLTSVEGGQGFTPYQGTPSGNEPQLKWLARPDAFFRVKTEHTLDGLKAGVGGPKDLKGQKQP
jgi:hypothetical protein